MILIAIILSGCDYQLRILPGPEDKNPGRSEYECHQEAAQFAFNMDQAGMKRKIRNAEEECLISKHGWRRDTFNALNDAPIP